MLLLITFLGGILFVVLDQSVLAFVSFKICVIIFWATMMQGKERR